MRVRWRGLELPTRVLSDQNVSTPTYGRFMIEPFERGFGTTVGNSLRRILLSSLEGAAVTSVKIAKADHEFTSIKGVLAERWMHSHGCQRWFNALRNTHSDAFLITYEMGKPRPAVDENGELK